MAESADGRDVYRVVRIIVTLIFSASAAVIVLVDAFSDTYEANPFVLGLLIGGALLAAGVEGALTLLRRGGG